MKNPLTRLFYYGIFGLGLSCAMIVENYTSKSNSLVEYIMAFTLLAFSIVFLVARVIIKRKQK